jgi:superfamily II RNA helicase
MFYTGGPDGLGYVVLDECHYMGNEGRGTVWEEIIVNAPKDVRLVALSATVANIREIADWISIVHRPIVPVIHPHRPVPLQYLVCDQAGIVHTLEAVRQGRMKPGVNGGDRDGHRRWPLRRVADPAAILGELSDRSWLPAIYFIFSRAGCERAMDRFLADGISFLPREQAREVDQAIREATEENPAMTDSLLNQTIVQGLRMGIGLHHAGILPSLKRLTELLFERGLVQVVFATETMSLGIHMPARSVVLQSLTKRTDRGFRALTHNELTQMAGRAGRRGIDPEGQCLIALDSRDSIEDVLKVVSGPPEPIESQFHLGYGSVALLLNSGDSQEEIRRRVESSFGQYQNLKRIRRVGDEVSRLESSLAGARAYEAPCGDFGRIARYRALRREIDDHRRRMGKERGRRRESIEAEPGRIVLVRRRGGGTLGIVLGSHSHKGREVMDLLLPHGARIRAKLGTIKKIFWATPPLPVPREAGAHHDRAHGWGQTVDSSMLKQLERLSLSDLLDRERSQGPESEIERIECRRCPWNAQPRCDHALKTVQNLERSLDQRREGLQVLKNAYWQEFCHITEVLAEFNAVSGGALTSKGRMIAGLRHDNELLVAEAVARGGFSGTTVAEAAALCSCLSEESRSGEEAIAKIFLKKVPKLRQKLRVLEQAAQAVGTAQQSRRLFLPVSVHPGFMPAVFRWASGDDDWTSIVEESFGGHEGDLIRTMRRLIDVLRQLSESPEIPDDLSRLFEKASRLIDRGIVFASALI